jgi:tetratricopeptide (TPR) repeat protein
MKIDTRPARTWLAVLALATLAAAPPVAPDELVRLGNAAFGRGDYALAVDFYGRAEERTLDPGLVAFNEATALYQLGRYREAELHYLRSREDATGLRRARLLYNLGNSVLKQGRQHSSRRLREAIASYEECLQQNGIDAELAADARHNLELARLLLQKAKSREEGKNSAEEEQGNNNPQADERTDVKPGGDDSSAVAPDPAGKVGPAAEQPGNRNTAQAKTNEQPPPGQGNLPPIPDEDDLAAMTPVDAAEHLKKAAARIQQERREYRQRPVAAAPANMPDW